MLSKRYESTEVVRTVEIVYICPRGLSGASAVTLTKELKYKKDMILIRCMSLLYSYVFAKPSCEAREENENSKWQFLPTMRLDPSTFR